MASMTLFAIVGMHRSGTSMMAETLNRLGLSLTQQLMPANEFNQRGYFEDSFVVKIQNRLLESLGRPWGTIRHTFALPADWLAHPATAQAKQELTQYIQQQIQSVEGSALGIKDPRTSLFLPMWQSICSELGINLKLVVCLRDIEDVANSLLRRDNTPLSAGRLMWMNYNSSIATTRGDTPSFVVPFSSWTTDPMAVSAKLAAFCDLDPPSETDIFDQALTTKVPATPTGVALTWQNTLTEVAHDFAFPPSFLACAETHLAQQQNFQVWSDFIEDETLRDSVYSRLELDIQHYRQKIKEVNLKAENQNNEYQILADNAHAKDLTIEALRKDVANATAEAEKNLAAYREVDENYAKLTLALETKDVIIASLNDTIEQAEKNPDPQLQTDAASQVQEARRETHEAVIALETALTSKNHIIEALRKDIENATAEAAKNLEAYRIVDEQLQALLQNTTEPEGQS